MSLPELPLLAVLPGTGGLTRVADKRQVRRDRADFFCTTEEGVRGKRALEWRLVDEVVPPSSKLDDAVAAQRAEALAAESRGVAGDGRRIALTPLERSFAANGVDYRTLTVAFDRARARRRHHVRGPDGAAARHRPGDGGAGRGLLAAGAGARARRRDPRHPAQRTGDRRDRVQVRRRSGAVLAYDALLEPIEATGWRTRSCSTWKRMLKRLDVTSRSLIALIEPGSCFAGTLAELVVRRRPLLHADRRSATATIAPPAAIDARPTSTSAPIRWATA